MQIQNRPSDDISTTDSGDPSPLKAWLAVGAVTIGAFAFVTTEFLPVGLLPQVAHTFGVLPGTAGLMVTIPGIMAAISAPGMMLGAGRVDRRLILIMLSVMLLASNLLSAFAPTFSLMLVGRALLGAGLGAFWTLALAAAGRLVKAYEAPRATAAILAGVTCATVIGVPLGTFIAGLASWRASFIATAVLVAVALILQIVLLPSLPSKAALRFADLVEVVRRPFPRKSLLMVVLVFGAHFSSYTYIAPFLQDAAFSASTITLVLLGFGIVGFVSNFAVSAIVASRLKSSLATMTVLLLCALLILPFLKSVPLAAIAMVLAWGIAFGAIPLCLSVWMQDATPDLPEAGSALFVGIIQVAIAVGSSVGGTIVDRVGIPADFWLGSALALLGLITLASFSSRDKSHEPSVHEPVTSEPQKECVEA
ncbi:Purine ribonucleoside efflux pump NepI [Paraburkholderia ultramafica]|uniref:Purine ribonucleoside efflux pump NepI n=1 Tax=Paraburkholderia ultramafica TaxID=1544867 RepID=A0A6S7BK15_9BURK|nr:MFS transporter [Paraburkholderia ultramafica]CAB3793945.1 Purine ribonucleoside efflux pump NepI [Paraburkholderia ultramafica]